MRACKGESIVHNREAIQVYLLFRTETLPQGHLKKKKMINTGNYGIAPCINTE
jgi:hypothetical protein